MFRRGRIQVSVIKKFQITNHKYQMVRQAHHLTTLSQVEGQITMTEIQNSKRVLVNVYGKLDSRYSIVNSGLPGLGNPLMIGE